ncbi:MAG TPA: hypothetical protein DEG17_03370 [Cyanobacteria bacterium UBA11149]|nr:hypothetical protein [Cyanobacteria bacterium UBA11367]HBE61061.1 hypothetical protein [Cyanobacteria bacterium UBA11366]HBK62276.1 hypothetical protein [Cyanobacteria bacterium UBA11166]HBR74246.1 hypothetical protein [Cyanobacteria bacterium UBA11159]HBS69857.1 hypothetical protein [Cyanobacteria bacterium UBA11153]HBW87947.1 hypothetical protein [Cyanobacteria bacterium UBA11149]HCA95021.1 hypothetical protein [Cyanobacteria bacterium UBA9226]
MPQIPLLGAQLITQSQGADLIAAMNAVQAVIGLLSSPDPNSSNAKLSSIIASIGNTATASTILKLLSDVSGGLGISSSTPAASPTATATAIGFLKLISSYLQLINKKSSICTKVTVSIANVSTPIITAGSKNLWMIQNNTLSTIYIEYGAAAAVAGGIPIFPQYAHIDDFDFTGAVNGIVASGTASIDYRVFT